MASKHRQQRGVSAKEKHDESMWRVISVISWHGSSAAAATMAAAHIMASRRNQ